MDNYTVVVRHPNNAVETNQFAEYDSAMSFYIACIDNDFDTEFVEPDYHLNAEEEFFAQMDYMSQDHAAHTEAAYLHFMDTDHHAHVYANDDVPF